MRVCGQLVSRGKLPQMPKHARDPRLREWLQAAGLSTQRTEEVLVVFEEQGVDSVADVHLFEQQPEFDQLITASVVRAKVHAAAKRELEKVADTGNGAEGEAESSSDDEDDREDEDTIGSLNQAPECQGRSHRVGSTGVNIRGTPAELWRAVPCTDSRQDTDRQHREYQSGSEPAHSEQPQVQDSRYRRDTNIPATPD